ncbi:MULTISPECIES: substrate-binding periplasmic protein [Vibrio]|uniref:substrate-binding periplasmic protein n=1 Tax=Vibrio TaxID=662 RepID=UPI0003B2337C|nr:MULTISPECIES: transporter substrate-binding domain-containing protein [Vibrio]UAB71921.1 transporter substrate-binding domain-containing protein [Vibrio sp. SCSIO 43132]BDU43107.1 amino acid ABC transporter substrate-binding protein [Vibrio nigripulchritudo]CCN72668.1 putative ABC-type amino acid transport/signal transduction systems, periplasmic component/domain [Vibrio nigripulchritudo SFn118]
MFFKTVFLFLSLLLVPAGNATQMKELIGVQDEWAPFAMSGENKGIAVDIVTEALKSQGYRLRFKMMPFARAIHEVKRSRVDILVATWLTEERTEYLSYSHPYFYNSVKFIKRKGDGFEYFGMNSLEGKVVGIVRSYGYGDEFTNSPLFERHPVVDTLGNLKKLEAGRIDLTLEEPLVAKHIMRNAGMDVDQFAFTKNALSINALHVSISNKHPNANNILRAFNIGLKEIKKNGTYWEILVKYGLEAGD